jgi:hypothetical protein
MIPLKITYTREEVERLLLFQHLNTKNEILLCRVFIDHDGWENVPIRDVNNQISEIKFNETSIIKSKYDYKI